MAATQTPSVPASETLAEALAPAEPVATVAETAVRIVAAAAVAATTVTPATAPVVASPVAEQPLRRRRRAEAPAVVPAPAAPAFLDVAVTLPSATSVHLTDDAAEARIEDEFERAARVFSFTGQTPVQVARAATEAPAPEPVAHVTAPRRGRLVLKRIAAASFSVSVVGVVGLLAVGTTTSALAVGSFGEPKVRAALSAPQAEDAGEEEIQAYVAASDAKSLELVRSDEYDVASMADLAAESGITQFASGWVNDPNAAVQWPFPVGVPISAHFGSESYHSKFGSAHHGIDFTPGAGAEIHAVADGVVRTATSNGGEYGVTVTIDHIIDGQVVSSRYGHMQRGSLAVSEGQSVKAGDVLGKVGSTGKSTGAHLHLEILLNGEERIDPLPWLREHTS